MQTLGKYESFVWFLNSLTDVYHEQYGVHGGMAPGPADIWSNTLQLTFRIDQSEVQAFDMDMAALGTNDYYFDVYYRPYDEHNDRIDYKKATLQAWSVYTDQNAIYRCKFYDAFYVKNDGLTEGQTYDTVVVVRKGDTGLGYARAEFLWTERCAILVNAAEENPTILK